ncbi:MAG: hypothetical protein LBM59_06850 [Ruminococcus sp.]|jgi:hypothetical protein|nr:hypothetical protein [Ruminococcus sp.]
MKPGRLQRYNKLCERIPLLYVYGCSFADYFIKKGIKKLSIYCDHDDFIWAKFVHLELALNPAIEIELTISDIDFNTAYPGQNIYNTEFSADNINFLTPDSNVLVLSSGFSAAVTIIEKTSNIHNFINFWDDCLFNIIMGKHFAEIHEKNPFLPIVLYIDPHFPCNKEQYTDMEIFVSSYYPKLFNDVILEEFSLGGGGVNLQSRGKMRNTIMTYTMYLNCFRL